MGSSACLSECPSCQRHVRCGERACPFCGARVTSLMRVLEYRLVTRLSRSQLLSLGTAMTAAGFALGCNEETATPRPIYGAPCNPPACVAPDAGPAATAGAGGSASGEGGAGAEGGAGSP